MTTLESRPVSCVAHLDDFPHHCTFHPLSLEFLTWVLRQPVWIHILPCLHYFSQSLHDLLMTSQSLSSLSWE